MRKCIGTFLILSIMFPVGACAVPVQFVEGTTHWYEVFSVPDGISWYDARDQALAMQAHLVTISHMEENEWVFNLTPADGASSWDLGAFRGPWLAGFQTEGSEEPDGGWHWADAGEPWNWTNWRPGEPNNSWQGIPENALQFCGDHGYTEPASLWNDFPADALASGFVVEYYTEPVSPLLGDLNGDGWVGQTDLNAILADWGHSPPLLPFSDPSGDGLVGQDDLDFVLSDWGKGTPPSVPEPATLSLLTLGGLAVMRRKRK